MVDAHKPDVVLKHLGRRAKHGDAIVVAVVNGFWGERSYSSGDRYAHPHIEFRLESKDGSEVSRDHVDLIFQQHLLHGDDAQYSKPQRSGFMKHEGKWSTTYGGRLEARSCEYRGDRRFIRRVLDLLDKAAEQQVVLGEKNRYRTSGDDLLDTLVRLRRCGVEIRIYNAALRKRRYWHRGDGAAMLAQASA